MGEAFDTGSERVRRLCAEYIAARERGQVSPEPFLERAGDERPALAAMLATLADLTPCDPIALGRFRLLGKIDGGGQSSVFLAHDPDLRRQVAVKLLRDTHFDRVEREWVLNEARSVARLEHPGLVRVLDVGHDGGRAFLVMEHLAGPSLRKVLRGLRGEGAPEERAREVLARLDPVAGRLELLIGLAEALAHCHERGVLHRDVKPENILFDQEGNARFIDFGLAHTGVEGQEQLLITQRLIGTPGYIAPEQIDHERTGSDPRSDQFAFGVLCYEVLTLERPFQGETATQVNQRVVTTVPRRPRSLNPALPASLERVVLHALEKDPGQRYPTLAAMAADLRAVRDLRPVSVEAPGPAQRARLWVRRNRKALAIGAAVGALLLGSWIGARLEEETRARRLLRGELDLLRVDAKDPRGLTEGVNESERLLARAADLQRSWTAFLFSDICGLVRGKQEALAAHCADAYRESRRESETLGTRFQSDDWSGLALLLRPIAPRVWEQMDHRRLLLPAGVRPDEVQLLEQVLHDRTEDGGVTHTCFSGYREYREIPFVERPGAGVYRVRLSGPDGRLLAEADFRVADADLYPITLELRPPDEDLLGSSHPLPSSWVSLQDYLLDPPPSTAPPPATAPPPSPRPPITLRVEVPAFHLSELVTRSEAARFARESGILLHDPPDGVIYQQTPMLERGPDAPAWLPFEEAEAYARWRGGRLPTACELLAANAAGRVPVRGKDRRGHGEWVSDLAFDAAPEQASLFKYDPAVRYLGGEDAMGLMSVLNGVPVTSGAPRERLGEGEDSRWIGTCFRVAFSDP